MGNRGGATDFQATFARATLALEQTVYDLLSYGWDENFRVRAYEMALALTHAAKSAGHWETEGVLRAIGSLLALSAGEVAAIQPAVRDKLTELLNLLKRLPLSQSA